MLKKIKFLGIICGLFLTLTLTAFAASGIKIVINGKEAASTVQPTMQNGSIMVPLRFVSEQLGMDVKWDGNSKIASINNEKTDGENGSIITIAGDYEFNDYMPGKDANDDLTLNAVNTKRWAIGSQDISYYVNIDDVSAGSYSIKVDLKDPSGKIVSSKTTKISFVPEELPSSICDVDTMNVDLGIPGIYWLELYSNGKFVNKAAIYSVAE